MCLVDWIDVFLFLFILLRKGFDWRSHPQIIASGTSQLQANQLAGSASASLARLAARRVP
jgi:hypothetical protein